MGDCLPTLPFAWAIRSLRFSHRKALSYILRLELLGDNVQHLLRICFVKENGLQESIGMQELLSLLSVHGLKSHLQGAIGCRDGA